MSTPALSFSLQLLCFAAAIFTTCSALPGTWKLLVANAGISSMHTAVTRFNTVILLDRTDNGNPEIMLPNGRCRTDPTTGKPDCYAHSVILNLENNAIRPVEILTDTWCSSGQFLPDGSLLQSGGQSDGFHKFRRFYPCQPDAFCDWIELENVALHDGRWYATNQILPDGTMIIVGGRQTNTLEYYPPKGGAVNFPFLAQTNDAQNDNLYPYLHLLPNGLLFVFANVQSVLYDYTTNKIVKTFPNLEGGPRNYPSAGSSAMLALEGDYSSATIVICGGAQAGAFRAQAVGRPAQASCGRIVATDANPGWAMENMPFGRIMGDMVMLPTGDVLIINGAQAGSQGYGMATNPALHPVLYQPDKAAGLRFMTLAPTGIPRVYHSTANLLPDGRVLVAGSNTHFYYTYTGVFPSELRIEAFSPAYLAAGVANLRPVVVDATGHVHYGEAFVIFVTVPAAVTGVIEVNFASAPYTTHSFSQGQRLIKLVVTAAVAVGGGKYRIGCTAPPNANVAPPGYYMLFAVNQGVPSVAAWVHVT